MSSNVSISNHGSGPQNNNTGGTQNNFFWHQGGTEVPLMENAGVTPDDRPRRRKDFQVAIICALAVEYDAVSLIFDKFWDGDDDDDDKFGRAQGDPNTYIKGRIGKHDVVLTLLSNMGVAAAAGAVTSLRSSYPSLNIAILVGICGGVPGTGADQALLGDVVISKTVRHNQGRQYPNAFITKDKTEETIGRPNKRIRNVIASLGTQREKKRLREKVSQYLKDLQSAAVREQYEQNYQYPGVTEDKLFAATYRHKHQASQSCGSCNEETDSFCKEAAGATCTELRCDESQLVSRKLLETKQALDPDEAQCPKIIIGCIQSGDTVMKSGAHRDQVAKDHDVIAFEMEGAGAWDELPCIVIKGICDYADTHKNKVWQPFAAATAASVMKAVLRQYDLTDSPRSARSS